MSKSNRVPPVRTIRLRLANVDGRDPERQSLVANVGESRITHRRRDLIGIGKRFDRRGKVAIRVDARPKRGGDERREPAEIEKVQGAQRGVRRNSELEHDRAATRPDPPAHLGKATREIGEVTYREARGHTREDAIGKWPRPRASCHETDRASRACSRPREHLPREVQGDDPPAWTRSRQRNSEATSARTHIERGAARPESG